MALLVCSCGGNTDTDTSKDTQSETTSDTVSDTNSEASSDTETDTETDTESDATPDNSDIIINDNLYKVFVCDEEGNGLANIFVQYCTNEVCLFGYTDANGYIVVPSNEYHVALVVDEAGVYAGATYDASNYPEFEGDSKLITVILTK